ncbi:hypothetical protein TcCL_ESM03847 [Trypanosoma cruzi]|nr:hypothetical protein TcCL_ESM03847 [Trypanosoma cruzi]
MLPNPHQSLDLPLATPSATQPGRAAQYRKNKTHPRPYLKISKELAACSRAAAAINAGVRGFGGRRGGRLGFLAARAAAYGRGRAGKNGAAKCGFSAAGDVAGELWLFLSIPIAFCGVSCGFFFV